MSLEIGFLPCACAPSHFVGFDFMVNKVSVISANFIWFVSRIASFLNFFSRSAVLVSASSQPSLHPSLTPLGRGLPGPGNP